MMTYPVKHVRIADKQYDIAGPSESDAYFNLIHDDFEAHFRLFCRQFVQDDYVCLDIGANIGMKSLMLAQFVPHGKVVAVEAAPVIGRVLDLNIAASKETNIIVSHSAISDADGEVTFAEDSAYGHISSSGVSVPARRVSTLLAENGLERLDFVKIDVEGFEFPILKDALTEINQHRALVYLEFNSLCQIVFSKVSPYEFAQWILANFSHVFVIRPREAEGRDLHRLSPDEAVKLVRINLLEDGCVTDLLVTNAPERLEPAKAYLVEQRDRAVAARDEMAAQLAEALARCAALEGVVAQATGETARLSAELEQVVAQLSTEHEQAVMQLGAELDQARRERDHALATRKWSSRSWRRPLRDLLCGDR